MPKTTDKQRLIEAAILASRGLTQSKIADVLGIDPSAAARRLEKAVLHGYLVHPPPRPPELVESRIPRDLRDAAEDSIALGDLRRSLLGMIARAAHLDGKPFVREVTIVRSRWRKRDAATWDERAARIGRALAARFAERLPHIRCVGVVWGRTMRSFADALREAAPPRSKGVVVVPLGGEPMFLEEPYELALTATEICRDLAETVTGSSAGQCSLSLVPAFIPRRFEADADVLLSFFRAVPGYQRVFGDGGFVHRADTIITSMAGMKIDFVGSPWFKCRLETESGPRVPGSREDGALLGAWEKIVAGDLAGILIPRRGISATERGRVDAVNARLLGLRLADLERCAQEAVSTGSTGVVLAGHGESKADVLHHAILARCANELVIDDELAESLAGLLRRGA